MISTYVAAEVHDRQNNSPTEELDWRRAAAAVALGNLGVPLLMGRPATAPLGRERWGWLRRGCWTGCCGCAGGCPAGWKGGRGPPTGGKDDEVYTYAHAHGHEHQETIRAISWNTGPGAHALCATPRTEDHKNWLKKTASN